MFSLPAASLPFSREQPQRAGGNNVCECVCLQKEETVKCQWAVLLVPIRLAGRSWCVICAEVVVCPLMEEGGACTSKHTHTVTTVFPASNETIENVLSDRNSVRLSVCQCVVISVFSSEHLWSGKCKQTSGSRERAQKGSERHQR